MKNISSFFTFSFIGVLIGISVFIGATRTQTAFASACKEDNTGSQYCLLEPIPLGTSTLTMYDPKVTSTADYINIIIKIFISIIGVLGVIMIILGGIEYMSTDAISKKEGGREKITHSLFGLLLALASWVLLNTINPHLTEVNIDPPQGDKIVVSATDDLPAAQADANEENNSTATVDHLCTDATSCKPICDKYCAGGTCKYTGPNVAGVMDPSQAISSINIPGVTLRSGSLISPNLQTGLQNFQPTVDQLVSAGKIPAGTYSLLVYSGYRPLSTQLQLACDHLNQVPSAVAAPGGSPHGKGVAADIYLSKDGSQLDLCNATNSKLFDQIMSTAGWSRYSKEAWHYEYNSNNTNLRCQFPNCPTADNCHGF